MKCYFVAQIKIHNDAEYQKYLDNADAVFSRFKGKYLAVDNSPVCLEGKWDYTKSVIIEFPSRKDLQSWYFSEEYQTILKHRLNASYSDTIVVNGLKTS